MVSSPFCSSSMDIGLRWFLTFHSLPSMSRSTYPFGRNHKTIQWKLLTVNRIVDNAHLLDATEIFRKLNVHKKVSFKSHPCAKLLLIHLGIFHQARISPRYVLLLLIQYDRSIDQRRYELIWIEISKKSTRKGGVGAVGLRGVTRSERWERNLYGLWGMWKRVLYGAWLWWNCYELGVWGQAGLSFMEV